MRFLFWNTYENTNINSVLCNIVVEQKINVITLAEYKSDLNDLIKRLWLNGVIVQQYITAGCERIIALGTEKSVAPNLQDKYYTIQQIGEEYLLCAAHLPSKCRKDDDTQELTISRFIRDIEQVEKECNIQKTIIATVYKGNIIKNLIMDCQSYTKYRPNETTGGIFVSWRRKEELPTGGLTEKLSLFFHAKKQEVNAYGR